LIAGPPESKYQTLEETMSEEYIEIRGARENNLKNPAWTYQ